MFGLGMWEILLILALALIFIGPKKLPDIARSLGRGFRDFKRAANELRDVVDSDEPMDVTPKRRPDPDDEGYEERRIGEEKADGQTTHEKSNAHEKAEAESEPKPTDADEPEDLKGDRSTSSPNNDTPEKESGS